MMKELKELKMHGAQVVIPEEEYREILERLQDIEALTDRLVEEKWRRAQMDGSTLIRLQLHDPEWESDEYFVRLTSAWSIPEQLEPLTQKVVYWAEDAVDRIYGEKRDVRFLKGRIKELEDQVFRQYAWKIVWLAASFLAVGFAIYTKV